MKETSNYIKSNQTDEKLRFYEALKGANSDAIRELARKITPRVRQLTTNARLSKEDTEELINDALVITIKNIRAEKFKFMDITPSAYALGVIRKLIANRIRTKKPITSALSGIENVPDFSPDEYLKKKEREQLVGLLLSKLGETCQKLLKLRFFESLKDNEIIQKKLTPFSSINSLKSKRSQCLKKLTQLAKEGGYSRN